VRTAIKVTKTITQDTQGRPILPDFDEDNATMADVRKLVTTYLQELWGESDQLHTYMCTLLDLLS
jgi:hypothetical protein